MFIGTATSGSKNLFLINQRIQCNSSYGFNPKIVTTKYYNTDAKGILCISPLIAEREGTGYMLNVQVKIYSPDTGDFYSNREAHLHWLNHKLKSEKHQLNEGFTYFRKNKVLKDRVIIGVKDIKAQLKKVGISEDDLKAIETDDFSYDGLSKKTVQLCELYKVRKGQIADKNKRIKASKKALQELLARKVESNIATDGKDHIRVLNHNTELPDSKIISVFDSSLTRMIGIGQDELTDTFMVVQVYYFDIIKDLIYYGFMYKGEKYIYFTSSAGQIRTKKTVFIKESIWKQYEKTIMCGLTIESINAKGGNNPNKHLAYMALSNSATDMWDEFDIDKSIVIDDFETNVFGTYDLISDEDYSIRRVSDYVPITHTDGAGMMLPVLGKNRMVRLPWVKGLLGVFDFVKFIEVHGCSPIIKDIYGKEHDVISEGIQVIFTKSQFKMYKYYESWEQYKEYYKFYNCTAGYTNMEEDRIRNATINYQMLQTLTDATDDEILKIAAKSINKLNNLCSSIDTIKAAFGVTPYNMNKTALQQAIELYPNLINDEFMKRRLKDIKDSMIKQYKSGKLEVNGKYTFLMPDYYAACEYWFCGEKNPTGLLYDNEVFCWLFRKSEKLDCLRSPHLFKEHAIRENIAYGDYGKRQKQIREWFTTDAVYTSCHDLISKILQFDVDGDKSLVVSDKDLIEVAERNMKNIVPLYYNMKKAQPTILNNQIIFDGLKAAFTGGNIGIYSNNISKIWNSDIFLSDSEKEKKHAIDLVKILCMENNFVIDYAKTLYKPVRPKDIHKKITSFTRANVPAFFQYAKDKTEFQIEDRNDSFVNKLESLIPNPRINCRGAGIGKIDYQILMSNPDINVNVKFRKSGKIIESETDSLIVKYHELNQKYACKLDNIKDKAEIPKDLLTKYQQKQMFLYGNIIKSIKDELNLIYEDNQIIVDILVKYLYHIKPSRNKTILWLCYGDYILDNIKKVIKPEKKKFNALIVVNGLKLM